MPRRVAHPTKMWLRMMRETSRRAEARAILTEVYNWFSEGFDTADLKDAKALLDQLNRSP
jgi:hypothetical protein